MRWPTIDLKGGQRSLALATGYGLVGFMAGVASAEPGAVRQPASDLYSLAQPAAVFGSDKRVALPVPLRPLREMLGILFNVRQRTVCTAFCVAPGLIGTAAHCLYKTNGEKSPRLADFWFARNYDVVRDYSRVAGYETGTSAQSVLAGSTQLSTAPPIDATKDWAFIKLATPICNKGTFEIETLNVEKIIQESKAGHVYQISYHKDFKQWQPAFSKPCAVERSFSNVPWSTIAADFSTPESLLLHTCDTGGASSGSPLLLDTPQGPKVIGINVGTYVQSRTVLRDERVTEKTAAESIANTGVASSAFAPQLTAFRNARLLLSSVLIRELQERLQTLGYYSGAVDGTYGPTLKLAISAYQSGANMPKTGLPSEDVLARIRLQTTVTQPLAKTR